MKDIAARELKGHNILAVERFWDSTFWMIEFTVLRPTAYGEPGDEMRLFLTEDGYQSALQSQQRREIKIKRYAHVIEGHILDFKPKNTVVHNRYNERKGMNMCTVREIREAIQEDCRSQRDMESTEIDRVFQTLPFSQERDLFDKPPMPKRPYRRKKKIQTDPNRCHNSFMNCGFFIPEK